MVNIVNVPLVRSTMAIILELKLCPSNFSRGIERQKDGLYQGTSITLMFMPPVDLLLIPYF